MNGIYDSKLLRGGCVGRHIFQLIFEVEHIHGHTLVCQKNDGSIKISFFNFIILKPFFLGGEIRRHCILLDMVIILTQQSRISLGSVSYLFGYLGAQDWQLTRLKISHFINDSWIFKDPFATLISTFLIDYPNWILKTLQKSYVTPYGESCGLLKINNVRLLQPLMCAINRQHSSYWFIKVMNITSVNCFN